MADDEKPIIDQDVAAVDAISPVDVLAQCAVAVQASTNALLIAMQMCQEHGYFDASRSREHVSGPNSTAEARASTIDELARRMTQKSRATFMSGKKQPESPPPTTQS